MFIFFIFLFFGSKFIVPRRFTSMSHITFYGDRWMRGGGRGGGVIIVTKRTRPILLGSF